MNAEEILRGIEDVARRHVGLERDLAPDLSLQRDLLLDSLQLMTLAVEIENRFRVRIEPEDEASILTVADLVRVVAAKLAAEGR